jgi:16S rRNA (guanine966-N2)-methyltransferase
MSTARTSRVRRGGPGRIRIIAGRWRGRRLCVPDAAGLRPTPERLRETLFNWLRPTIEGARCLDLFAGSGALGLEALSRGAAEAVLVERDRRVFAALRANIASLDATDARAVPADVLRFLETSAQGFDIVFLDPPYDGELLAPSLAALERGGWLAANALVYVEYARSRETPALATCWETLRESAAGHAHGALLRCAAPSAASGAATMCPST